MLPGAEEYDYSLALTDSEPANGKVEIAAKLGADVAKVKYAFFEGVFGDAIAKANSAGIDAGTVESKEITADGTIVAQSKRPANTPSLPTFTMRRASFRATNSCHSATSRPATTNPSC